ncbi:nuclear transport factor 2 family protein [Mucilaginibacter sp. SMC90]|uniref:nuclear transport factor 2 family protein n=1 Tax=Mucilaginibacter sp. SMC90 TaxID=2929803 RepID=UPI001FB4E87C|nr:nuclear transport factor 2 family protein [Mucilaginibacter sp. SMC90]UOE52532.1 nuclear transport factor 2 family protein [Mucilaginibacter sp. SMC90]
MKKAFIVLLSICSTVVLAQDKAKKPKFFVSSLTHKKMDKIQATDAADKKAILTVIQTYIEGLRSGRTDLLKKSFYKDAIMYGFSAENEITEGSVQHLYELIQKNGALAKVTSVNSILHQTSNTASVLAELKNTSPDHNSTDYLSLMKINGEWKIISKVYHLSIAK